MTDCLDPSPQDFWEDPIFCELCDGQIHDGEEAVPSVDTGWECENESGWMHEECLDAAMLEEAGTLLGMSVRAVETVRDPHGRVA